MFYIHSSFIPPISTKENADKWYQQGYNIVDTIVNTRQELIHEIKQIIKNEIDSLEKESQTIRVKNFKNNLINIQI